MPALLALAQRTDDVAETAEAAVDVLRLLEAIARAAGMAEAFAAGEIDEVEGALALLARDGILARQFEDEDGVRPGRALVGLGGGDGAVGGGATEDGLDFGGRVELDGGDFGDGGLGAGRVVADLVFLLVELLRPAEEVVQILVVDFDEGAFHAVGPALVGEGLRRVVDLVQGARDHAVGRGHGVGFARRGLAVGEDAHVVAVQRALHELADLFEDVGVLRGGAEDAVEGEGVGFGRDVAEAALLFGAHDFDFFRVFVVVGVAYLGSVFCWLGLKVGPYAAEDSDVAFEFLDLVVELSAQSLLGPEFAVGFLG